MIEILHSRAVMSAGQFWLLPPPQPLVERLGREFFRELPDRPGVYLMCGPNEGVLYVGKAKSLRCRLGSYRVANPERMSRRTIRLLHQVTRIEWEECPSEAAAIHREELLIVTLNPKFNAAGKIWPLEGTKNVEWRLRWKATRAAQAASAVSANAPAIPGPESFPNSQTGASASPE